MLWAVISFFYLRKLNVGGEIQENFTLMNFSAICPEVHNHMPRTSVEINKPQVLFEPYDKSQKKKTQEANRTLGMFYFNENFPTDATKPKLCAATVSHSLCPEM